AHRRLLAVERDAVHNVGRRPLHVPRDRSNVGEARSLRLTFADQLDPDRVDGVNDQVAGAGAVTAPDLGLQSLPLAEGEVDRPVAQPGGQLVRAPHGYTVG